MTDAVGEDRSNYQAGSQPWSGNDFAMMKATEDTTYQDPTFPGNWATAKAEGKPRTAYHFFHPATSPVKQADYFTSYVSAHGLEVPDALAIDCELLLSTAATAEVLAPERTVSPRMHVAPKQLAATGPGCVHDGLPVPVFGATGWCMRCQQYCGGVSSENGQLVQCAGCAAAAARAAATVASGTFPLDELCDEFLTRVVANVGPHHPVLFYSYQALAEKFSPEFADKWPNLWVASIGVPAPVTGPWSTWRYWQWEFGGGPGGGDRDYYNGDVAAMNEWLGSFRPAPPPAVIPRWQHDIIARLPELKQGSTDSGGHVPWVKQAQLLLTITGPDSPSADGDFGPVTHAAAVATQKSRAIPETGVTDPATWQVLITGASRAVLPAEVGRGTVDHPGAAYWVRRIQAYCDTHGVPVTIDGDFGPDTENAVRAVQKAYGEPETGIVDQVTWSLLIAHAKP